MPRRRPPHGRPRTARDSLAAPVSPGKAFLLSLALPGLGQSRLNRPTAGGVYFATEAVWLAMLGKSANDLRVAKAHAQDVIVNEYSVDAATGAPVIRDSAYVVPRTRCAASTQSRSRRETRRQASSNAAG
ncbi:MAG: hypothetical protein IPF47_07115 [Gemmatimonadetes bacterium]|nr:hypothetical protein [Gemmatimonadota bacterium]